MDTKYLKCSNTFFTDCIKLPSLDAGMQPRLRTPPLPCLIVSSKFLQWSSSFFLHHAVILSSGPKMLNVLSSANRALLQYVSGLFIIDFANESLSFLVFALTEKFFRTERLCNPATPRSSRSRWNWRRKLFIKVCRNFYRTQTLISNKSLITFS